MTPMPQEKKYTYADLLEWPEDARYELIDGEPRLLSAPSRVHQEISIAIASQLYLFLKDKKCRAYSAPFDVRLFQQEEDAPYDVDTVVQPDIAVICDPEKLNDLGCRGAPDLIVEILSPATRRYDRLIKFNLYQRAGVREYWIVDPEARVVSVHTLEEGQYGSPAIYRDCDQAPLTVLEGCVIDLPAVFA